MILVGISIRYYICNSDNWLYVAVCLFTCKKFEIKNVIVRNPDVIHKDYVHQYLFSKYPVKFICVTHLLYHSILGHQCCIRVGFSLHIIINRLTTWPRFSFCCVKPTQLLLYFKSTVLFFIDTCMVFLNLKLICFHWDLALNVLCHFIP